MLSEKMQKAINAQINAEFWSAYLYLSMSADFAAKGMKGISNWFSIQFQEEQAHARIFMNYLLSRGGRVELAPIAEEDKDFATTNKLVWFVNEQVEEEETAQGIIDSLKMVDDSKLGLYMIDKELAARTYTAPAELTAE